MSEKTSKEAASAAARVLRDPNASEDAKSAAGSALTQREPERVVDSEHAAFDAWIDQHPLGYPGIEYDAFVAGYRAALQSQHDEETKHLRDALWVADRRIEALQSQDREDAELLTAVIEFRKAFVIAVGEKSPFAKIALSKLDAAIDHARRIEGEGE